MLAKTIALIDGNHGQAGLFAQAIRDALESKLSLRVLSIKTSRDSTGHLRGTNESNPEEEDKDLTELLQGVDVVFPFPDSWELACDDYQWEIAQAAHSASVHVFVPFQFGNPFRTFKDDPPVLLSAQRLVERCARVGLTTTCFETGPASDVVLPGLLNINDETFEASVTGLGQTPISWITSADVAEFIATLITTLSMADYAGRVLPIQGSVSTIVEVLEYASSISGQDIHPIYLDLQIQKERAGPNPSPRTFINWLMTAWEEGRAHVQGNGANGMIEGFSPRSTREILKENIQRVGLAPPPPPPPPPTS